MCILPDTDLYFKPSFVKVSQRVSELQTQIIGLLLGWLQLTKEHNSVKSLDGVMVLNLCTFSDDA